jgi:hypothetical protein
MFTGMQEHFPLVQLTSHKKSNKIEIRKFMIFSKLLFLYSVVKKLIVECEGYGAAHARNNYVT